MKIKKTLQREMTRSIHQAVDLGCGLRPRNPLGADQLIGIDILDDEDLPPLDDADRYSRYQYLQTRVGAPLPLDDESVDAVYAFDFLEHLPRHPLGENSVGEFIRVMNEVYRILRRGGVLLAATPCYPGESAFSDPTHVNFVTSKTHEYFSGPAHARALGYGFIGQFSTVICAPTSPLVDDCLWSANPVNFDDTRNVFRKVTRSLRSHLRRLSHARHRSHICWMLRKEPISNRQGPAQIR